MEEKKTGCLIRAAVELGLTAARADKTLLKAGAQYGLHLGYAFQLIDDILDVVGDAAAMGKTLGKDAKEKKTTAVSILGIEKARKLANEVTGKAIQALEPFGERGMFLREIAERMLNRVQ